jgi:hypothetical protein
MSRSLSRLIAAIADATGRPVGSVQTDGRLSSFR